MAEAYLPPETHDLVTENRKPTRNYWFFWKRIDQAVPSGGAAPANAEYIVATADPTLTAERVATSTTSITVDNSTAAQTKWKRAALTGDVTASADSNATTLANTAVTPGTYGDASHVGQFTVDSKGRLTFAANVAMAISSSRQLWEYRAKTSATSGYPGDGYLLWNNATQTSATALLFAHVTNDNLDIDLFLAQLVDGSTIILQDADASTNVQTWLINGTPTNTNGGTSTSYWTVPVSLVSSAGTGTTGFANNHALIAVVFAPAASTSTSGGPTLIGVQRILGDGATTVFNLLDLAEYVVNASDAGAIVDPTLYTLSSDLSQLTFSSAPTAGHVLTFEYVVAQF